MKTYLDCIPCFMEQALRVGRLSTEDEAKIKEVLNHFGDMVKELPLESSPPEIAMHVYDRIKQVTGNPDPFKHNKIDHIEKAQKLSPRDSDIRENLNAVRQKLGLAVLNSPKNPLELLIRLRDSLRPDEWLKAGVIFFLAGTISGGILRWYKRRWILLTVSSVTVALLAGAVSVNQVSTSYKRDTLALIGSTRAQPRELPYGGAAKKDFVLEPGQRVKILESRPQWCQVRIKEREFWIKNENLSSNTHICVKLGMLSEWQLLMRHIKR